MAPLESRGGPGRFALVWEGLGLRGRPKGITGQLELGDGSPRPARPGYGFLLACGVCGSAGWCSRRLGAAPFIGERRGGFGLRRWTPVHGARRRAASVRGGEGDATHAATVGERGRAQNRGEGDEHSAHRTVTLAGPCPCLLQRALASVSARGELRGFGQRWWRGLARYGSRGSEHARNRARGGTQSAATHMPAPLDERGHHVDYEIRPS